MFWIALLLAAGLLTPPASRGQAAAGGDTLTIVAGPWKLAESNPVSLKEKGLLCIVDTDHNGANVELVYLHDAHLRTPFAVQFVGYDATGGIHNFVDVTSSTSKGNILVMDTYQMETPATANVKIVSIAMAGRMGDVQAEDAAKKYTRTTANMRSLAIGIESYYVDNNAYPAWTSDVTLSIHAGPAQTMRSAGWSLPAMRIRTPATGNLMTLTTPVAYLTKIYDDPFANQPGHTFQFYSGGKYSAGPANPTGAKGWILWSPGPDGRYDIDWQNYDPDDTTATLRLLIPKTYDPTNGTQSAGDVWRISGHDYFMKNARIAP